MNQSSDTPMHKGQNEGTAKRHRTTVTSRISFKQLNESGQRETEKKRVFDLLLQSEPLTSRQVARMLKVERTNITRTIRDLMDTALIGVKSIAKCETTGKKVQYYTAIDNKELYSCND